MTRLPALLLLLLLVAPLASCGARDRSETRPQRDARLIGEIFEAMPPQRSGHPDLYVVGFAGDGHEDVFRNEVAYLEALASRRMDARGRVVSLVNHADSLGGTPRPLATLRNLRHVLARIGEEMDPAEDLLLLFLTTHGTEDHELVLQLFPVVDSVIRPGELREALDQSGIRWRVVVVSACYSGGFLPALRTPDTLAISAAGVDRTSFGCGSDSVVTDFGRAFLVEGLNQDLDFAAAFDHAATRIERWEREDSLEASMPQIHVGTGIARMLPGWRAAVPDSDPEPYPYALP
ncbi:C13 family peptidase [Luteimonas vadosa]|uniref:Peptidase C13 n=1 Tax=Luteimonas vadosa TaxID=1165507 RepID=A0ABP9E655_9GAMM